MVDSGKYWKIPAFKRETEYAKTKRLSKEKQRLEKEVGVLRQRDILQAEIKRAKKEKFYRSRAGKVKLFMDKSAVAFQQKEREWVGRQSTPQAKAERKRFTKNFVKQWNKIAGG